MIQDTKSFKSILDAREDRFKKQLKFIKKYSSPIISFTLNLPGIHKNNEMFYKVHKEAIKFIEKTLEQSNIEVNDIEICNTAAGYEAFFSCKCDALFLKKIAIRIEENHELGRLFDIDILNTNGIILSRSDLGEAPRKCLICNNAAHICVRSRAHSIEELYNIIYEKINNFFVK